MGGANTQRIGITGADWMRDVEKRILHEERRPQLRTASDLMGPGLAPYSVEVMDWNAPETAFNGFFHSEPGAVNSPDGTKYWMGITQGTQDGYGLQRISQVSADGTLVMPPVTYVRSFWPGFQRQFSTWTSTGGTSPGGAAGGDLSGTYPNPQIAIGSIADADISPTAGIQQSKINGLTTALNSKYDSASLGTAVNPPISLTNIIGSHAELTMKDYGWPVLMDEVGHLRIPPAVIAADDTAKWSASTLIDKYPFGCSVMTVPSSSAGPGGWPSGSATILTVKRFDSGFNAGGTICGYQLWVQNTSTDSGLVAQLRNGYKTGWTSWLTFVQDTGWVNLTPVSGTGTLAYRCVNGVVALKGGLSGLSVASLTSAYMAAIGAIPAAYRPSIATYAMTNGTGSTVCQALVNTDGSVSMLNPTASTITVFRCNFTWLKE